MSEDTPKAQPADFEEALEALETLVRQLEGGKIKLAEAVAAYEKGVELKAFCEDRLKKAQMKVETLSPPGAEKEQAAQ